MTVFGGIPAQFPLKVDLTQRPARYVLAVGGWEKVTVTAWSLFWLVFVPHLIMLNVSDRAHDMSAADARTSHLYGAAASALYVALAGWFWLWPNIASCMRNIEIEISTDSVDVRERGLFGVKFWSEPLANYQGVCVENRGTHTFGTDKRPVTAIVLKHRDKRKSIPIAMSAASTVSTSALIGRSKALGVPLLQNQLVDSEGDPIEPGQIVVNRYQSLKVRLFYIALLSMAAVMSVAAFSGTDPYSTNYVFIVLALAAAMHVFCTRYVVALHDRGETFAIRSAALFQGSRTVSRSDVIALSRHEGRQGGIGFRHYVHAPYVRVKIRTSALPYIIDLQSDYVDQAWIAKLTTDASNL